MTDTLVVGPVQTNCYIVYNPETREAFVVDPGDDAPRLLAHIREKALRVSHIICTHGHFDHILAVAALQKELGAKLCIHKLEAGRLQSAAGSLYRHFSGGEAGFPAAQADILLDEGDSIHAAGLILRVLHTPGHSPGSLCLDSGEALYSGDTLFEDDCGRTDLPGGDPAAMCASLRRLHDLSGDRQVYPGHGPATTFSRERAYNIDMRRALR